MRGWIAQRGYRPPSLKIELSTSNWFETSNQIFQIYPPQDSILLFKSSLIGLFCSPNRGFFQILSKKLRQVLDNGLDNRTYEDEISKMISHILTSLPKIRQDMLTDFSYSNFVYPINFDPCFKF